MVKIEVSTFQNKKTFRAFPFDAYIGEIYGKGRKHGYYIQLARGTSNMNNTVKKTTFKSKAQAEKVIRKWLKAQKKRYDAEYTLKRM